MKTKSVYVLRDVYFPGSYIVSASPGFYWSGHKSQAKQFDRYGEAVAYAEQAQSHWPLEIFKIRVLTSRGGNGILISLARQSPGNGE